MRRKASTSLVAAVLVVACARGLSAQTSTEELKRMSLEDVLNIEISTVSRQPEATSSVPAAVYVITQEDIQRSGATSIPDVLRLAPGIQVARIDAGKWAIGMRGFADRLARSMLVMMDGRAVYSPLFAGTYWEVQDTVLADIVRIEVIRGPGGTLWGANAVNGIINIVTRRAADSQGLLATGDVGTDVQGLAAVRYGGSAAGGNVNYRIYGKASRRGPEYHADGNDYDGLTMAQAGGRSDWTLSGKRTLTVQGDIYHAQLGERGVTTAYVPPFTTTTNVDAPLSGGNVLARLAGPTGDHGDFQLQAYYDRTSRDEIPVAENRDTFDVDFQQTRRGWARHQLTWGLEYRATSDRITTVGTSVFVPDSRTDNLFSLFGQDEIALVPNKLRVSLGAKVEHNAYSGFEVQPSARVSWTPTPANFVWAAVTRAVRTPSRVETDYSTTSALATSSPTFVRLLSNPAFVPEELVAYETGYRLRPAAPAYLTLSGFYNRLQHTLSTELLTPFLETTPGTPRLILPVDFGNGLHGASYGAEATADIRATKWWRWTTNYSYLRIVMSRNPGSQDVQERNYEGLSPRHQLQLQSSFDLSKRWSVDWLMRYISELKVGPIPAYGASTVRVAWQVTPAFELAIVGQDLNQAHHVEWASAGGNVAIQRSAYVKATWRR